MMYGIDMEIIIMALGGVSAFLLLLIIILFVKISKLNKKYQAFMSGEDGKSLEGQVKENYNLMKNIELKQQQQELDMLEISDHVDDCASKMKLVKYNAFRDIGGQMSFALTVLNEKKNGYILNCVHSDNGSYIYAKEVKRGQCGAELSKEEEESLLGAL
ncbi:MAG: DUF4446 family protein [Lachnospiraceae bacterium]|nr:DUF4446 family protein [Lachnospiraceae bacterium]